MSLRDAPSENYVGRSRTFFMVCACGLNKRKTTTSLYYKSTGNFLKAFLSSALSLTLSHTAYSLQLASCSRYIYIYKPSDREIYSFIFLINKLKVCYLLRFFFFSRHVFLRSPRVDKNFKGMFLILSRHRSTCLKYLTSFGAGGKKRK